MAARSRRKGTEVSDAIYSSMVKVIPNSRVNPPADFVCCACSEAGPGILVRCSYCENDGKQRERANADIVSHGGPANHGG